MWKMIKKCEENSFEIFPFRAFVGRIWENYQGNEKQLFPAFCYRLWLVIKI